MCLLLFLTFLQLLSRTNNMSESFPDFEDVDDNDDYDAEQYFDSSADDDLGVETLDSIFAAPPQNPQYGLKRARPSPPPSGRKRAKPDNQSTYRFGQVNPRDIHRAFH